MRETPSARYAPVSDASVAQLAWELLTLPVAPPMVFVPSVTTEAMLTAERFLSPQVV